MPLPIGHTAIAVATFECTTGKSAFASAKRLLLIALLANLPDIDIIIGLLVQYNAKAFHRGPTHSLVFALMAGWIAWCFARSRFYLPSFGFRVCFYLVLSHVVSDALFTGSRVSLFWPFELNWTEGAAGWLDVIHAVVFNSLQDIGIVILCFVIVVANRLLLRPKTFRHPLTHPAGLSQSNKAVH